MATKANDGSRATVKVDRTVLTRNGNDPSMLVQIDRDIDPGIVFGSGGGDPRPTTGQILPRGVVKKQ